MARRTLYTEPFTHADEDPLSLSGGWSSGYTGAGSWGNVLIASNAIRPSSTGAFGIGTYATAVPNDQWASAIIAGFASNSAAILLVRYGAPGTNSGYLLFASGTGGSTLYKITTGSAAVLGSDATNTVNGDVPMLEAVGTLITFSLNGTPRISVTDATSTYAAGRVGLGAYVVSTPSDIGIGSFDAGDYVSTSGQRARSVRLGLGAAQYGAVMGAA